MLKTQIFIISWAGQHERALAIAKAIESLSVQVTIIFSDPDSTLSIFDGVHAARRSDKLFWGDKFQACLDMLEGDNMLVIHADCDCESWEKLVQKCIHTMSNHHEVGVWAPLIKHSYFALEKTSIGKLTNFPSLNVVAQTDGIIFCLDKSIVRRMKLASYKENVFGWGIEWMFVSHTYMINKIAVIDESITVSHRKFRGYPSEIAYAEMNHFLTQLSLMEHIHYTLLNSYVNERK